jgi:flagellar hook-length control protein FliK
VSGSNGLTGGTETVQFGQSLDTSAANGPTRATASQAASVSHQVSVQLTKAIGAGNDRISIQLDPAELGRIDVKLEIAHDGRVVARVTADRPETLDMLQRDYRGLERALQQAGLQTDSDSLNFNLRQGGQGEFGNHANGNGNSNGSAESDEVQIAQTSDGLDTSSTNTTNRAADGRLDIQV